MADGESHALTFSPPAPGSRVSTLLATGKWGAASVELADGNNTAAFPFCLRYETTGFVDWVRFVNRHVLEAWPVPKPRGKQQQPAAPPPGAATEVRAYFVLPPDVETKGRPSTKVVQLREEAKAAAEAYSRQQQQQQQPNGDGEGPSPAKRPRLAPRATTHAETEQQQQQQPSSTADGTLSPGDNQPQQGSLAASQAGAEGVGRLAPLPAGITKPVARHAVKQQRPAVEQARAAVASEHAAHAMPQQQQPAELSRSALRADVGQDEPKPAAEQQPAPASIICEDAANSTPLAAAVAVPAMAAAIHQADALATVAAAPKAEPAPPAKRPAVTELGAGTFEALAVVPMQAEDAPPPTFSSPAALQNSRTVRQRSRQEAGDADHPGSMRQHQQKASGGRPSGRASQHSQAGQQRQAQHGTPAALPSQRQQAEEEEEAAAAPPEPSPERPGDVACRQFAALLPGLTLLKESITAAAASAINAGQLGACKGVVRCVLEHMRAEPAAAKRVVHFYLLDAVLAHSRKEGDGCGPESVVGTLFPRTVGAALSQLVDLLGASLESAQKMEKTLSRTWLGSGKRGVEASLVQRALEMLRERIAQHEVARGADGGEPGANGSSSGGGAAAAAAAGPQAAGSGGAAAAAKPGAAVGGRAGVLDEAGLWRLLRKLPMRAAPLITFVNLKDGSKVRLTHAWQPDVWPDYDALPLPPAAMKDQFSNRQAALSRALAAEGAGEQEAPAASPWHGTGDSWEEEGVQGWPQGYPPALGPAELAEQQERLTAVRAAQLAAAAQAQRLALLRQQQARVRSTSAAAEADEFDAGLFRDAAGGVAPLSQAQLQGALLPGLLQPAGAAPAAPPPLPDQPPPLPEDAWTEGYGSDDEGFGPPPLPPHSPPKDEYELQPEGESPPPPLPPEVEDMDAEQPPLPSRGGSPPALPPGFLPASQLTPPAAAGYQGWGGYGTSAPGMPPHAAAAAAAAFQPRPGWPGMPPAAAQQQHAMLPPGIGLAPGMLHPAAAMQQQQVWAAQQQAAAQAFLMRAAASQQQQAAMMGGMMSPGMPPQQQALYSPAMTPAKPHLARQQQQQQAAGIGAPARVRPPQLPPPG